MIGLLLHLLVWLPSAAYHLSYVHDNADRTFSFQIEHDSNVSEWVVLRLSDNIGAFMNPACDELNIDNCLPLMYIANNIMRRIFFAPNLPHALAEDHWTTRLDLIRYIQFKYGYYSYLEIGIENGVCFTEARKLFQMAYGVDPVEGPGTHQMLSDEFFASNTEYFDLIFIDGSHHADQVMRDVDNALRWLSPGGTIVMHDCNPGWKAMEDHMWSGDTWKALVALRLRPDVEAVMVDIDLGVGVVRRRPNRHPLPLEWVGMLQDSPLAALDYDRHLYQHRAVLHRLMTMEDLRRWLAEEEEEGDEVEKDELVLTVIDPQEWA